MLLFYLCNRVRCIVNNGVFLYLFEGKGDIDIKGVI